LEILNRFRDKKGIKIYHYKNIPIFSVTPVHTTHLEHLLDLNKRAGYIVPVMHGRGHTHFQITSLQWPDINELHQITKFIKWPMIPYNIFASGIWGMVKKHLGWGVAKSSGVLQEHRKLW